MEAAEYIDIGLQRFRSWPRRKRMKILDDSLKVRLPATMLIDQNGVARDVS